MINIRSITYTLPDNFTKENFQVIDKLNLFWDSINYFVRTKRVTLPRISSVGSLGKIDSLNRFCEQVGIRWFDVPLDVKADGKLFNFGYRLLKNYDRAFVNIICVENGMVDFRILNESLRLIKRVSQMSSNGADNFRLGLSVNVLDDCPFFPFSISSGNFGFSIALELTQEINRIAKENKRFDLNEFREKIIDIICPQLEEIEKYALDLEEKYNIRFNGFDFSLAPIIETDGSVISILKYLGVDDFSSSGTMFLTSYLTNILKYFASKFRSVGFSGVMYSLLEDLELCQINNKIGIRVEDMVKLSTMCGCGLDMIPISSLTDINYVRTLCLDVIGISSKLNKPLGIRILPINDKGFSNFYTDFKDDADFISNTKVLNIGKNNVSAKDSFKYLEIK